MVLGSDMNNTKNMKTETGKTCVGDSNSAKCSKDATETTSKKMAESKDPVQEDVPEDFFDDFLKDDFIAGLDIIDEDEGNPTKTEEKDSEKSTLKKTENKDLNVKTNNKKSKVETDSTDSINKSKDKSSNESDKKSKGGTDTIDSKNKSKDKSLNQIDKKSKGETDITDSKNKSNDKSKNQSNIKSNKSKKTKIAFNSNLIDVRRDPEKTRQAIERDKIKSEKDKEKRLITDIVETGLVPPGMELEVNLEEVNRISRVEKNMPLRDLREKLQSKKSKSKSVERRLPIEESHARKRSPPRRRSLSPIPRKRSRSPRIAFRTSPTRFTIPHHFEDELIILRKSPVQFWTSRYPLMHPTRSPRVSPGILVQRSSRSPLGSSRRSPRINMRKSPQLSSRKNAASSSRRSPPSTSRRSPPSTSRISPPSTSRKSPPSSRRNAPSSRRSPPSSRRSPPSSRRSGSRSRTDFSTRRLPLSPERDTHLSSRRNPSRSSTSRSAAQRRSKSRSPISRRRERVTTSPKTYRRNRSFSPKANQRSRRYRSRSPRKPLRKEEKMSFLEEIAVKLNETRPPTILNAPVVYPLTSVLPQSNAYYPPMNISQPVPQQPVTQVQPRQFDYYDESFFIGTTFQEQPVQQQLPKPEILQDSYSNGIQSNNFNHTSKLLDDKRIKLSDMLAITTKPQVNSSSSQKLEEKVKVIQLCQEAIKILEGRRYMGPLSVFTSNSFKEFKKGHNMSPLLRQPVVQLPFTSISLKKKDINFSQHCEELLKKIGIQLPQKTSSKPTSFKEVQSKSEILDIYNIEPVWSPPVVSTNSLSTQTDQEISTCKECHKRSSILYANCGIQAGNPILTFSVSTQVNEADFYSMIPKTQSLASMTPAQLLGKQSMLMGDSSSNTRSYDHNLQSQSRHWQENRGYSGYNAAAFHSLPNPPPPPAAPSIRDIPSLMSQQFTSMKQNQSSFGDGTRRSGFSNQF